MHRFRSRLLFLLLSAPSFAQIESKAPGVAPIWQVQDTIDDLTRQTQRYKAIIDQLHVDTWIADGAPDGYLRQQKAVQDEVGYLANTSARLKASPEKLSIVIEAYFRLQALESITAALAEGVARYQSEELGEQLGELIAGNATARAHLRQYMFELAVTKEQELAIASREAHRCQAELNRNPLAPAPRRAPVKKE